VVVEVVRRDVQQHRHLGAELVDRQQLEARHLERHDSAAPHLEDGVHERYADVAPGDGALAALGQHRGEQARSRGLAVRPRDRQEAASVLGRSPSRSVDAEPVRELDLAPDLRAARDERRDGLRLWRDPRAHDRERDLPVCERVSSELDLGPLPLELRSALPHRGRVGDLRHTHVRSETQQRPGRRVAADAEPDDEDVLVLQAPHSTPPLLRKSA
jgi:hypothetical protein